MSNRKQRDQNRATYRDLMSLLLPPKECVNCHQMVKGGHFVPPSFGQEGFFICTTPEQQAIASEWLEELK